MTNTKIWNVQISKVGTTPEPFYAMFRNCVRPTLKIRNPLFSILYLHFYFCEHNTVKSKLNVPTLTKYLPFHYLATFHVINNQNLGMKFSTFQNL
jgi:hypothetical protein